MKGMNTTPIVLCISGANKVVVVSEHNEKFKYLSLGKIIYI